MLAKLVAGVRYQLSPQCRDKNLYLLEHKAVRKTVEGTLIEFFILERLRCYKKQVCFDIFFTMAN